MRADRVEVQRLNTNIPRRSSSRSLFNNGLLQSNTLLVSEERLVPVHDRANGATIEAPRNSLTTVEAEILPATSENANAIQTEAAPAGEIVELETIPRSPSEDPNFGALENRVEDAASTQQAHEPAIQSSAAAQQSALSPANERTSQAQAGQVAQMDRQQAGEFDVEAFKAQLVRRIESMQLPANEDEADDFDENNNIAEVNSAAMGDVRSERDAAAGALEGATQAEPNVDAIPERDVIPLSEPPIGAAPPSVSPAKAMPPTRPESHVSRPLQDNMSEVDRQMQNAQVTDDMLANSNEPTFAGALEEKNRARRHTDASPVQFRSQEQSISNSAQANAEQHARQGLSAMHRDRSAVLNLVAGNQQQTASSDTAERTRIAGEINAIFERTRTEVETILSELDSGVSDIFISGAEAAKRAFENYVERRMDEYKEERYGGVSGFLTRVGDVFTGLPDEVNAFFTEGRQIFIRSMDGAITRIAQIVVQKLTAAKTRIAQGKREVENYVAALPQNLRQIGREAANDIRSKFDALEQSVDAKQGEIIDQLATAYMEQLQEVDTRIEEMQAENRGLVDIALDAIGGVIQVIINIKNMLMNLLASALDAIGVIISDPIGFLGNLISGIGQGLSNFGGNILKHLQSGLIQWLTGSLGPVGITIPKNLFSLEGIFDLVAQVLGITWDFIRRKAVKLVGEPIVQAMEKGFELFQIIRKEGIGGLWKYVKQQFQDLKETVIGAIKSMVVTTVIEAGIKWILGLLSPAGAFVKAAMAIIEIVKFFIERGSQIIELVKAFIDGVKAVASGSVEKVAQAIENALVRALPVVIGFLAALLGIGKLASKVQLIIKKIRKRIDRAVTRLIMKAKKTFKGLVKKGKKKAKKLIAKFVKWWKKKERFKSADKGDHEIYYRGKEDSAKLYLASTNPDALLKKLDDTIAANPSDTDNKKKIQKAKRYFNNSVMPAENKLRELQKKARLLSKPSSIKTNEKATKVADKKHLRSLQRLKDNHLSKIKFGGDSAPTTVRTNAVGAKDTIGRPTKVTAEPLTWIAGNTSGSRPREDPIGWNHANSGVREGVYIRGHLLNDNIHGPGDAWNMVPMTRTMNTSMETQAEKNGKVVLDDTTKIMFYQTTVDSYFKKDKIADHIYFPSKITVTWGDLMKDGKYDETGARANIKSKSFTQGRPAKPFNVSDLGETLLANKLGLDQPFAKAITKERKANGRFLTAVDFRVRMKKYYSTRNSRIAEFTKGIGVIKQLEKKSEIVFDN